MPNLTPRPKPDVPTAEQETTTPKKAKTKKDQKQLLANRRATTTIERAIEDYLSDHEGGNHSKKTLEWHHTALGLLQNLLPRNEISLLSERLTHPISTPGLFICERRQEDTEKPAANALSKPTPVLLVPFSTGLYAAKPLTAIRLTELSFPKVGKPLIRPIEPEEFERLLLACTPPGEVGPLADRAAARNRAILWVLYDTGIRLSELLGLKLGDFDRKHGMLIVKGKGSKERRVALGNNCLRNLLYYLDRHRPDEEELTEWGNAGEEHLFLSETRLPLTKNGLTMLFKRIKERSGITDKRISPHIFRHSFAIRYLVLGNDPFSLQELLGHEDMTTVKNYMHMNDETIQSQKRKYSPGDHLPTRMPGPKETRRKGFQTREKNRK